MASLSLIFNPSSESRHLLASWEPHRTGNSQVDPQVQDHRAYHADLNVTSNWRNELYKQDGESRCTKSTISTPRSSCSYSRIKMSWHTQTLRLSANSKKTDKHTSKQLFPETANDFWIFCKSLCWERRNHQVCTVCRVNIDQNSPYCAHPWILDIQIVLFF